MKLFTISDMAVATGFARVMESIIQHFPDSWDISSLGINYRGDPYTSRAKIYPAILGGDVYGVNRLRPLLDKIKPDRIFILQDSWIIKEYLKIMTPEERSITTLYVPVDAGPYMKSWLKHFGECAHVVAYTEFGKQVLLDANPELTNLEVIPHGIDPHIFYPVDRAIARAALRHIPDDLFVILNPNRNLPRKRLDISLWGFALFAQNKKDVAYYHHAGVTDAGWNILELATRFGIEDKLILTSKNLSPVNAVPNETLNLIYNAADVGLNTSVGEGWSLCFAPGTRVLTTHGFKAIENIAVGDLVITAKGTPERVTKVFEREYSGTLQSIRVSGNGERINVTPEHPVLTSEGILPISEAQNILKPELRRAFILDYVDLTHYLHVLYANKNYIFVVNKKSGGLKISRNDVTELRLALNSYKLPRNIRKYKRWLPLNKDTGDIFGYLYGYRQSKTIPETYVSRMEHYLPLDTFCTAKSLILAPAIYMGAPDAFIMAFVKSVIANACFIRKDRGSWLINARGARYDCLRIALSRLGLDYYVETGSWKKDKYGKYRPAWYISLNICDLEHFFKVPRSHVVYGIINKFEGTYRKITARDEIAYTGPVYNLEVESEHTYLVDGFAVHNCNMEHAITGKPQVIPEHSALKELYANNRGVFLGIDHYSIKPDIMTLDAVTSPQEVAKKLEFVYTHREEAAAIGAAAKQYFEQPKFTWENIAASFRSLLE